jgi:PAS domain-containing protein
LATTERYVEGAVDFIFAPVQPDELRAKVSVFAGLYRQGRGARRQAREVQVSVDQLRLLTDSAPVGIFQTDDADRFVYTNPRFSEITGISAEIALGSDWRGLVDSQLRSRSTPTPTPTRTPTPNSARAPSAPTGSRSTGRDRDAHGRSHLPSSA